MFDSAPMRGCITRCICEPLIYEEADPMIKLWGQSNKFQVHIYQAMFTHGGVSKPIIIICANALNNDQLHCVYALLSSSPAYTTQLSSGKSCILTSIKLKQPIQCPKISAPTPSLVSFVKPSEMRIFNVSSTHINKFFT